MLVYEEFFADVMTLTVRARGWARMDHGPIVVKLQSVAVVDGDRMTIHYGLRVLDHFCYPAMTSDWRADSVCNPWVRIVESLGLRPMGSSLWATDLPPLMTLEVLKREFDVTVKADWTGHMRFWEESRVRGPYTRTHVRHAHLLMSAMSLLGDGGICHIGKVLNEIEVGITVLCQDYLYRRAINDELSPDEQVDPRALESSFRGILDELLAVRQVEIYPVGAR